MDEIRELVGQLSGKDDHLAEGAVGRLAARGAAALPALQELLDGKDVDARWWAVRTLADIHDPQSVSLLTGALCDPDAGVRQCAALGLRRQPDPLSISALVSALSDPDHLVRELAADALVANGSQAVTALLEVLKIGRQPARLEAVRALALIADQRSLPALYATLEGSSALMEYWANEGLDRMGVGLALYRP